MMNVKEYSNEQLVAKCVKLDEMMKNLKAELDVYKTELTNRGLQDMVAQGKRQAEYSDGVSTVKVTDALCMDFVDPEKMRDVMGDEKFELLTSKVESVSYKFDSKLDQAIRAIANGDYTLSKTINSVLNKVTPKLSTEQKEALAKKLSGKYDKDKQLLCAAVGMKDEIDMGDKYDTVLLDIHKAKNGELIKSFIPEGMKAREAVDAIMSCFIFKNSVKFGIETKD